MEVDQDGALAAGGAPADALTARRKALIQLGTEPFDVLIVGAGSAGAVLAAPASTVTRSPERFKRFFLKSGTSTN